MSHLPSVYQTLSSRDTVGSVGVVPKRLPFTTFNTHVKHFRHALALDEHRVRFKPNFFNRPTREEMELGLKWGELRTEHQKPHRLKTLRELERQYMSGGQHYTDVEEVWFAGCHCGTYHLSAPMWRIFEGDISTYVIILLCADVGGGAVKNEIRNNLARIPLRWMIRECFKLKTGILFQRNAFKVVGLDYSTLWPKVKPRAGPATTFSGSPPARTRPWLIMGDSGRPNEVNDFVNEEEEDLADALSDANDMLKIAKSWWILEYIPQKIRFQKDDDSWIRKLS